MKYRINTHNFYFTLLVSYNITYHTCISFSSHSIIDPKFVDLAFFDDEVFDCFQAFQNYGLIQFISMKLPFYPVSQHAILQASEARLTGALFKGGKMRGVATNVYLWKTSEKPKETGHNENSKFGSCIYA